MAATNRRLPASLPSRPIAGVPARQPGFSPREQACASETMDILTGPKSVVLSPSLVAELVPSVDAYVRDHGPAKARTDVTKLTRFLRDDAVSSITECDDATGARLVSWLGKQGLIPGTVRVRLAAARVLLDLAPVRRHLPKLVWSRPDLGRPISHPHVDADTIRSVVEPLVTAHDASGRMLSEGARLRALATSPETDVSGEVRSMTEKAVAVDEFVRSALADKTLALPEATVLRHDANDRSGTAPDAGGDTGSMPGYLDFVRWSVPTLEDMGTSQLLTMALTGWNRVTTLNLDVAEEANWAIPAGFYADGEPRVEIRALKSRSGIIQTVRCRRSGRLSPFRIISDAASRTEPLRQAACAALDAAKRHPDPDPLIHAETVSALTAMTRSPWLYFRRAGYQGITGRLASDGTNDQIGRLLKRFWLTVTSADTSEPAPREAPWAIGGRGRRTGCLVPSDFRDSLATVTHMNAAGALGPVKAVLGSVGSNPTAPYLGQEQTTDWHLERFASFMDLVFDEVREHGRLDPAALYLRVRGIEVTDEHRALLLRPEGISGEEGRS